MYVATRRILSCRRITPRRSGFDSFTARVLALSNRRECGQGGAAPESTGRGAVPGGWMKTRGFKLSATCSLNCCAARSALTVRHNRALRTDGVGANPGSQASAEGGGFELRLTSSPRTVASTSSIIGLRHWKIWRRTRLMILSQRLQAQPPESRSRGTA